MNIKKACGMLFACFAMAVTAIPVYATDSSATTEASRPSRQRFQSIGYTGDYSDIACYCWLTEEDVADLTLEQLRVLRNTIYARHGRKFKSADLRRFFSRFDWYRPRYAEINPKVLSKTEKHNIALIQRMERYWR